MYKMLLLIMISYHVLIYQHKLFVTVLYECSAAVTMFVLVISNCAKYLTTFHATPFLHVLVT